MYSMYFKSMLPELPVETSLIRINNVYRDINKRPISCITWTNEEESKLAVAYCNTQYPVTCTRNKITTCYLWDLENPSNPIFNFEPSSPCWQFVASPVQSSVIIAGLESGKVCLFDVRKESTEITSSPEHRAHRDPVSSVVFIQSRTNSEFFSGSSDGQCMWWDTRNLSEPTNTLMMAVNIPPGQEMSLAHAEGVSTLQFDRAFPTKFLAGTDTGLIINVNRKGKTHSEIMSAKWNAHLGPVRALHRSPCITKMFISCGDWSVRVWSEDIHTSPIINGIPHRHQVTDIAWAPQKASSYMTTCADGIFRYWDLLRRYEHPLNYLKVSKFPLIKIKPHEEGRLVAIADIEGNMYLLTLSESLVNAGSRDKQIMVQAYERETKREHILEARVKEIKLKLKADEEAVFTPAIPEPDETINVNKAEDVYKKMVTEQLRILGGTCSSGIGTRRHR